ncbi:DUF429 domain-containing protein [Halorussus halophilus]|uniref:DUF429 domain-containing protein n=1 Tax=Halorussus halophilus TaxID=2650975 RepID=UPI00130156A1|nr:DUF429 domain-containing protein [Halorussus halophilus]
MASYVGADWASNGWVVAEIDGEDELTLGFAPTVWNLWHEQKECPDQLCIDVPVGLPESSRRECDAEAKVHLGERRNSVFWTPIRDAVYEDRLPAAKERQTDATDYSISNQTWAIVPRIREVDTFLRESDDARGVVRESHPEVCFHHLNGGELLRPKSDDDGLQERRELLDDALGTDCESVATTLTEPGYARRAAEDDVLDAIVLALTAKRVANGEFGTLPDHPPTDRTELSAEDEGLPMEIVYPETGN